MPRKSKRSPGTCSITKRGKKWQVRYAAYDIHTGETLYDKDGNRVRHSKMFETSAEANAFAADYIQKRAQHRAIDSSSMLFSDYITHWFTTYKFKGNASRTNDSTQGIITNHLIPWFGAYKLSSLNSIMLQDAFNAQIGQLKVKTLKNIRSNLRLALKDAVEQGLLVSNPANNIKLPKSDEPEIRPLSKDEIPAFLKACEGDPFEFIFFFDLNTGLRKGELLGLTWDCVNLATGEITINKQLNRTSFYKGAEYELTKTKTENGVRKIYIKGEVLERLKKHKLQQDAQAKLLGSEWCNEWNLVFTNDWGSPVSPNTLYKHIRKIRVKINRPDLTIHSLRHTFATLLAESGLPLAVLKNLMGHSSITTTIDKYGAYSTDPALQGAADMIASIVGTST